MLRSTVRHWHAKDATAARALIAYLSGPEAAIVEFVAGRDRTFAFVVTASSLRAFTLNVTGTTLGRQVHQFRDQLSHRDLRATDSARALYDLMLDPLSGERANLFRPCS